jgi:hypothetical protein
MKVGGFSHIQIKNHDFISHIYRHFKQKIPELFFYDSTSDNTWSVLRRQFPVCDVTQWELNLRRTCYLQAGSGTKQITITVYLVRPTKAPTNIESANTSQWVFIKESC